VPEQHRLAREDKWSGDPSVTAPLNIMKALLARATFLAFLCMAAAQYSLAQEYVDTNGDGHDDIVMMAPFIVSASDPETFDWEGYYQWLFDNGVDPNDAPDPTAYFVARQGGPTAGTGTGQLSATPNTGTTPSAQSTDSSCGPNAAMNAAVAMGRTPTSERQTAQNMANSIQQPVTTFENGGDGMDMSRPRTQLNAALNPMGLQAGTAQTYSNQTDFTTQLQNAANSGNVLIAWTHLDPSTGNVSSTGAGNHMVTLQPTMVGGNLTVNVINSGQPTSTGQATVTTLTPAQAFNVPVGNSNVWPVSTIPATTTPPTP
jgi:hypothetical protein